MYFIAKKKSGSKMYLKKLEYLHPTIMVPIFLLKTQEDDILQHFIPPIIISSCSVPELRPPSRAKMEFVIPADMCLGWTGSNKLQSRKLFKDRTEFPSSPEKSVKKNLAKNEQPLPFFFEVARHHLVVVAL